jgi:D-glycero-alpha-D-manno-heptose 1-phosphate guanylyltransferase
MTQKKSECLILAGGLGTRLKKINPLKPKPMIPVLDKPFLYYQLIFFKNSGIKNILISTGFMGDQIENFIKTLKIPNLSVSCIQENEPLGTGGAIKNAIDHLDDNFIVCNGDTISIFDLQQMIKFHKTKNSILTMLIKKIPKSSRYGSVKLNSNNQILKFQEKTELKDAWISAGFFILNKSNIPWKTYPSSFPYEKLLFSDLIKTNKVFGYSFDDYFIDIGTPESFKKFEIDIKNNDNLKILFD